MSLPRRILVRAPNWIGDHVMARAAYRDLRRHYPDSRITLLSRPNLKGLAFTDCFDDHELLPKGRRLGVTEVVRQSRRFRRGGYDLAISFPASLSSALLFALAAIPFRVGFGHGGSELFHTDSIPWEGRASGDHKSRAYQKLVAFVAGKKPGPPLEPEPGEANRGNYIVVAPGASIPLREWPHYQELFVYLRKHYWAFRILVVGSGGESRWQSVLGRLGDPKIENWIDKTDLPQLVELCRGARLVIANDSGVAHLAATLAGAPTVVLFGPGDPKYVAPVGDEVRVVRLGSLPCSPCESAHCKESFGYQACLRGLASERVAAEVAQVLP